MIIKKILYFLLTLVIIAFIVGLFVTAYKTIHTPAQPVSAYSAMHRVLAIDFNNDGIMNQQELLLGQDAVLAVKKPFSNQMFNGTAAIGQLDINKDHRLDKKDKLFSQLELIFFIDNGKSKKYISLEKAGIVAIILDKKNLEILNTYKAEANSPTISIGQALTDKGKLLQIRIVPVGIPNN